MLIVLSPAKRLDWSERPNTELTSPEFVEDAAKLAETAAKLSVEQLGSLMRISADLARLNADRFEAFSSAPDSTHLRPAAFAFAGDTYAGLEAPSLDEAELGWAQRHLRILSGLYGVLRPMDGIQPYRLEMGSRLQTDLGANLYDYWGDRLANALNRDAAETGTEILLNCASQEYFRAVPTDSLSVRVVTPVFLEDKPNGPKIVSFWAKKARGAMARFVVQNRITEFGSLQAFDTGGYRYCEERSEGNTLVFLRPADAVGRAA